MKLFVDRKLFSISEIECDMMQTIVNALIHENKKNEVRMEYLNQIKENYPNEDILETDIEMTNSMLDYISYKHKEIKDFLNSFHYNKL